VSGHDLIIDRSHFGLTPKIGAAISIEAAIAMTTSRTPHSSRNKVDTTTLYTILGVYKTATSADIKAAYRALALKHHPDKGGDSDTFKIIARAYKVLSDDDTRQRYDRFGEEGSGGGARPPAPPAPLGASSTRVTVAVTKFRAPCCWCGSRGHRPAQCPEWRCWTCRSPHHMKAECPERGCWTCGSYDHMQVQCPERNGGWLPR